MQLYSEGPFDKVVSFINVKNSAEECLIPDDISEHEAFSFVAGKDLGDIVKASYNASAHLITSAGRPNCTFTLDALPLKILVGFISY